MGRRPRRLPCRCRRLRLRPVRCPPRPCRPRRCHRIRDPRRKPSPCRAIRHRHLRRCRRIRVLRPRGRPCRAIRPLRRCTGPSRRLRRNRLSSRFRPPGPSSPSRFRWPSLRRGLWRRPRRPRCGRWSCRQRRHLRRSRWLLPSCNRPPGANRRCRSRRHRRPRCRPSSRSITSNRLRHIQPGSQPRSSPPRRLRIRPSRRSIMIRSRRGCGWRLNPSRRREPP